MVKLNKVTTGVEASIFTKLEFLNSSGSIKDKIALKMIEKARVKCRGVGCHVY